MKSNSHAIHLTLLQQTCIFQMINIEQEEGARKVNIFKNRMKKMERKGVLLHYTGRRGNRHCCRFDPLWRQRRAEARQEKRGGIFAISFHFTASCESIECARNFLFVFSSFLFAFSKTYYICRFKHDLCECASGVGTSRLGSEDCTSPVFASRRFMSTQQQSSATAIA